MADLPADLDELSAMSLRRLNSYRIAAGLAPYRYDPALARMAQAHVAYARSSSRAGQAWSGHFEVKGQPGYSDPGHEAAATSGISYGLPDALAALEQLVTGAYHRLQFLRPRETRVGVGFGAWEGGGNSIALFVTRAEPGSAPGAEAGPRFVLFPPPDSSGIGTTFGLETRTPVRDSRRSRWPGGP